MTSVSFSPDGLRIVCCSNKTIKVWDAATGAVVHTLEGHNGLVNSVSFCPDGLRIASSSNDKTIMVFGNDVDGWFLGQGGGKYLLEFDKKILKFNFS